MTDRTPTHEVLRQQKVAALALNYEVAALHVRLAALKLQSVLERNASVLEARFNPYHDDLGRFTTADGAITGPGHALGDGQKPSGGGSSDSSQASDRSTVVAGNEGPKILGRAARDFGTRVSTPSPKDIKVRIGHIIDNHTLGGSGFRTSTRANGNKTAFPERMTPQDIDRAVREAYSNSREVRSPRESPDGKIRLLEGDSGDLTIQMFYNSTTKEIESAFPKRE